MEYPSLGRLLLSGTHWEFIGCSLPDGAAETVPASAPSDDQILVLCLPL